MFDLIDRHAKAHPGAVAVMAPGTLPLDYAGLVVQVTATVRSLRALGIRRADLVAVVLPNGPELATALLGVMAAATCAPLNPTLRTGEFDFFLSSLKPRALILAEGIESPAIEAARTRRVPILRLHPGTRAGLFELSGAEIAPPIPDGEAGAEEVALVLHTSGTTSHPKLVPLTRRNVTASARHIGRTLHLKPTDRCLNIMPLFHIHGLMAAVRASLAAGASVCCTPGFYAPQFFDWLLEATPTWYTAVPSAHQAILARATEHVDIIKRVHLRFIRSSSAPLPPPVMTALEETFHCPVIESYGMTEAAHQVASNPLPPRPRKPGSVGLPAGPCVGIMDRAGNILPPGARGEVVIRGPNVTAGYATDPESEIPTTTDGWLRTGDEGYLDSDGYLFVTGRLKEIINRGGEKVSPREVDEVLLDHPAVAQAVTFAISDPRLGEAIAAAVVLRPGHEVTELALRTFASVRLANFKVPEQIVFRRRDSCRANGQTPAHGTGREAGLTRPAGAFPRRSACGSAHRPRNSAGRSVGRGPGARSNRVRARFSVPRR